MFQTRLKELRSEQNLTQKALASQLNLSTNIICEWEKGRCSPNIETLKKLSKIFKCSIDYLLGNEDDFGVISFENVAQELTSEERELLEYFRKLNTLNRMHVSAYAKVRFEDQTSGAGGRRA